MMTGIIEIDISLLNPAIWLIFGGLLILFLPASLRRACMVLAISFSFFVFYTATSIEELPSLFLLGYEVKPLRFDNLSYPFVIVFHIAAMLNAIYSWHEKDRLHCAAGLIYPASAIGGVLAGDFLTLFIFWEFAAISSVFFLFATGEKKSYAASLRYLIIQIASGVLFLMSIVMFAVDHGSILLSKEFVFENGMITQAGLILLIAVGIKSAFPLLHNWVQDAYPKATMSGTILLSIFTTKLAVYVLARLYAGYAPLLVFGAIMTLFPIFFALIENDLRKVLCYSINNQVGFMVIGIGIGTSLSVNGAVGYAFCNIIFESLLFMVVGAVYYRTNTTKATQLGGLYKSMPLTLIYCLIGSLSISAFPFFSGFVTKGLIISEAGAMHNLILWLVLLFASAGVLEHAGIKIPYFIFFAHDSGKKPKEAPFSMQISMALSAILSIWIGVNPSILYNILPYASELNTYNPYSLYHITEQLQLLSFAVLAFAVLIIFKIYPAEKESENLDTDWFYRVLGTDFLKWVNNIVPLFYKAIESFVMIPVKRFMYYLSYFSGPMGYFSRFQPTKSVVSWVIIIFILSLLIIIIMP